MLTGNKMRAEEAKEVNSLEQPVRKKEGSEMSMQEKAQRGRAESLSGEALLPMPPCPPRPIGQVFASPSGASV